MMNIFHSVYRSKKQTFVWAIKNLTVICMIAIFIASPYLFEVSKLITWILLIPVFWFFVDYCYRNIYNK